MSPLGTLIWKPKLNEFLFSHSAWVIVAEVYPLGLRAKGVSIGASSNWLNNFAVAMSTPDFVAVAPYGAYIFLGLMCVLAAAYVAFLVPETKGRTLDELDELFGDNSGRSKWEADLMMQAQQEVGLLSMADLRNESSVEHAKHSMTHEVKA